MCRDCVDTISALVQRSDIDRCGARSRHRRYESTSSQTTRQAAVNVEDVAFPYRHIRVFSLQDLLDIYGYFLISVSRLANQRRLLYRSGGLQTLCKGQGLQYRDSAMLAQQKAAGAPDFAEHIHDSGAAYGDTIARKYFGIVL